MMKSNSASMLNDLAKEINEHNRARHAAEVKGVMHALKIGELLIDAKKVVSHGKFIEWVEANTDVSQRMAQMYMIIAADPEITEPFIREYETVSHLTINIAVKLARQHRTRKEHAERIRAGMESIKANHREAAEHLRGARDAFEKINRGADFKPWLMQEVNYTEAFADKIPALLDGEHDDEAWFDTALDEMVAKLESQPKKVFPVADARGST